MIKRIISLMVIVIMAFAFTACDGGNALKLYKTGAKDELVKYAREKGEDNYSEKNWAILQRFVEDGKDAINNSINKSEIDTALVEAKDKIDSAIRKDDINGNLLFTVSVENPTVVYGEYIIVHIDLTNISGHKLEKPYEIGGLYFYAYYWSSLENDFVTASNGTPQRASPELVEDRIMCFDIDETKTYLCGIKFWDIGDNIVSFKWNCWSEIDSWEGALYSDNWLEVSVVEKQ